MKTPTQMLRDEHVVILRALEVLESAAGELAAGREVPAGWWNGVIAWFRAFADLNHHAKEEESLFPAIIKAGGPVGPIDVMLEEHAEGRALIQAMAASEPADWARAARRYVGFLRDHIDKENSIVFPLADAVLDAQAVQVVSRDFESVQVRQGRAASIDEAGAAVDRLAATLASPADRCEPGSVVRPRKAGC